MNQWSIGSGHVISTRLNQWTNTQIKPKMHEQHKTLCNEYKNATLLEEVVLIMQLSGVCGIP
jgi:hypothetical protein